MDNIAQDHETILIALLDATFLLNSGRALQAIELCKECLNLLLNNTALCKEDQRTKRYRQLIYTAILHAYLVISDYTNAAIYA